MGKSAAHVLSGPGLVWQPRIAAGRLAAKPREAVHRLPVLAGDWIDLVVMESALTEVRLREPFGNGSYKPGDPTSSPEPLASPLEATLWRTQLDEYLAGTRKTFSGNLSPLGSPFSVRVWEALLRVPWGQTVTYQELAQQLGEPAAARAVGGAVGRNPIPIVIPCHRVIAARGLGGYSGGLSRKRWLLRHEGWGRERFPKWAR